MRHVFLVNPAAGQQDQTARFTAMADSLHRRHSLNCTLLRTDGPGSAEAAARRLAQTGEPLRLYVCGGDGTAHEAACGIAGFSNAAMPCIPAGTGNDLLRNFGADAVRFQDAENLWDGPAFPLDLIDCSGRLCLTIACNGIDARVADSVRRFSHLPLLRGRGSYLASVAANFLFRGIGQHWHVSLDGAEEEGDFALVSMCNGRYYGGGSTFARLFGAYSAGQYRRLPAGLIRVETPRVVRIRADEPFVTCLDGECFSSREVTMRLSEKRLNFFGPKGCSPNATAVSPPDFPHGHPGTGSPV